MTVIVKSPTHSADMMFAAAQAAFRINDNEYVKVPLSPSGLPNKTLALQFLGAPDTLTEDDIETGRQIRRYCQGLTLKLLKNNTLSQFEQSLLTVAEQDLINESNVALIAYSPVMYARYRAQQRINDQLEQCLREHLGTPGDKITSTVEVIRSVHSEKYGCYFITTITECNHNVFFSYKEALKLNQKYSIKGTVKSHRDAWSTQLTRTKVTQI
jgi:hypothetical protein